MTEEEPAGRRETRILLLGLWASGPLYLLATPAPYRLKLSLIAILVVVQVSNIVHGQRLRDIRLALGVPGARPVQRWRDDATRSGWPLPLLVGLGFTTIAMLLAGAVITFLGGASH